MLAMLASRRVKMNKRILGVLAAGIIVAASAVAVAQLSNDREPTAFFPGHTHDHSGLAVGAPAHSGGTDANGCHNASVPYHCH